MDEKQQDAIKRMGEIWALLYYHFARVFSDRWGVEGEAALRRAIRKYGKERGMLLRSRHLHDGLKISIKNLFEHYDLPSDPRTTRDQSVLTDEVRISETKTCQFADLWMARPEGKRLGRIYCEEVHHAIFGGYDCAVQTNLTQTITQGDPVCRFSIYLRPANQIGKEQVSQKYVPQEYQDDPAAKITDLFIQLYYHMAREMMDTFADGEAGLRDAIRQFGFERGKIMRETHEAKCLPISLETLVNHKDRPEEPRTQATRIKLSATEREDDVFRCGFHDAWKARGALDIALIYCQEVHHAMWETYDKHVEVNLPKTITAGDEKCEFRVYWKDEPQPGERPGGMKPIPRANPLRS